MVAAAARRVLQCVETTALMPAVPPGILAAARTRDKPLRHARAASGGLDARPSGPAVVDPSRRPHRSCAAHHTARHA